MPHDCRPCGIALMGPTAAGKTAFALWLAEHYGGEIISVDSALVYRHLDIGAAKPTAAEQARVRHHLLDRREPWQMYSVGEFLADAKAAVADVLARGRLPILAGGSSLYFQALFHGLAPMPEADAAVRKALAEQAARLGWAALHAQLAEVDPQAAAKIRPSDPQRIQRALEVWQLSGKPISQWQAQTRHAPALPLKLLRLVLAPAERAVLHRRIEARFTQMLEAGFLQEMVQLRALPALQQHPEPLALPALRAVGYRQAWQYLDGQFDFEAFRNQAIFATRQLAKRQLTWLRSRHEALWFDPHTQLAALRQQVRDFLPA